MESTQGIRPLPSQTTNRHTNTKTVQDKISQTTTKPQRMGSNKPKDTAILPKKTDRSITGKQQQPTQPRTRTRQNSQNHTTHNNKNKRKTPTQRNHQSKKQGKTHNTPTRQDNRDNPKKKIGKETKETKEAEKEDESGHNQPQESKPITQNTI